MPIYSRRRILLVASTLILLQIATASAQHTSSPSVAKSQRHLMQLTVADDMNTDVPLSVRDGIAELKRTLAAQTDEVILHLPSAATASTAKQQLTNMMPATEVGKISDDEWRKRSERTSNDPVAGLYGGELTIFVTQPNSSLLLVQERFNIACGADNILLVYSNAGGAWKRILLWQSKPYKSVGESFGDTYETLLLRPQRNGHPLLLVLHGTPWCTSTVSGFSMDVFELGSSSNATPIWHGEHEYRRLDLDPPLTVRATGDGFEVRTNVNVWAGDGNRVSRKGVMRYAIITGAIHRVEPIAMNAHDSVEEWLAMSRQEAVGFADEPAGSLTWTMFQDSTFRGKPEDADLPLANVGRVRACKDDPTHFQADVTSSVLAIGVPGGKPGPAYFVQLRQVPDGYRIHAVTRAEDPTCVGPDLMAP